MLRRFLPAGLALLLVALAVAPEKAGTAAQLGYASAYAPGVMESVIAYRFDADLWPSEPPRDWYLARGAIATNNCRQVGQMATLIDPDGREYRVLVADCAGRDSAGWMTENRIIAELDARLWDELTSAHGRPLEVQLR